jgi:hypothetical protein
MGEKNHGHMADRRPGALRKERRIVVRAFKGHFILHPIRVGN